jgi:hypothetical protein
VEMGNHVLGHGNPRLSRALRTLSGAHHSGEATPCLAVRRGCRNAGGSRVKMPGYRFMRGKYGWIIPKPRFRPLFVRGKSMHDGEEFVPQITDQCVNIQLYGGCVASSIHLEEGANLLGILLQQSQS